MPNASEAAPEGGPGVLRRGEPGSYSSFHLSAQEYPDAPGFKWTDTSQAAAEAIAPKLGRLQRLALAEVKARGALGLTADELAEAVGLDRYSIQPRTSELRRKSLIVDSGMRRRNSSGRSAIAWVTPEHKRGVA